MPLNWQFLATIFAKSPAAFEKRPADMGWIGFKDPCREKFTVRKPSRPLDGSSCFPSTSGSSGIPSKPAFWRNARIPFIAGKGSAKIYKQRRAKFCAARYFYAAGRPSQGCIEKKEKGNGMLWTIAVILFVLWLLGLVTSYTLGGLIHILLVVAIVVILLRVFSGRKGV